MNNYLENKVSLFIEKLNLQEEQKTNLTLLLADLMIEVATAQKDNPNLNFNGLDCENENTLTFKNIKL
jgi:hypothetical protein